MDPQTLKHRRLELELAHKRRRSRRYPSLLLHWAGRWLRRPAALQPEPLPDVHPAQLSLTFAGHTSTLIRFSNLSIAVNPMMGMWRGPIRREVAHGFPQDSLTNVDVVLITHDDPACLHPATLATIPDSATVIVPRHCAAKLGTLPFGRVVELAPDHTFTVGGVTILAAAVDRDEPALAYLIRGNGPTIFVCGASGYFDGFSTIGERYHPDIAVLPISGYAPSSFRRRNLSPLDALYAFEDLQSRILVPINYGSFALSYEHILEPQRWLAELVDRRQLSPFVVPLAPGGSRLFTNPARAKRPTPHAHLEPSGMLYNPSGNQAMPLSASL